MFHTLNFSADTADQLHAKAGFITIAHVHGRQSHAPVNAHVALRQAIKSLIAQHHARWLAMSEAHAFNLLC